MKPIVTRYFYQNNVQSPCESKVIDTECNIIYRLCLQNLWCLQVVSCIYLQSDRDTALQEYGQSQRTVSPKTIFALKVLLLVNLGRFACLVSHLC